MRCDVLVAGGGTGGCAAALAAASLGLTVIVTEPTDWIGGQLTSQAVPPDEHPWIESFGCTRRYRRYRNQVRAFYRDILPLTEAARKQPALNPGGGWVSRLCHDPRIGWHILANWMHQSGVHVELECAPEEAVTHDDRVTSVRFRRSDGTDFWVEAAMILDATELGDLLPLTGTDFVTGAESQAETGERSAPEDANPANQQAITWVVAMAYDAGSNRIIDRPAHYDRWATFHPDFWPGPLLGEWDLTPQTLQPRKLGMLNDQAWNFFTYRQIVDPAVFRPGFVEHPVTLVNWPMNDYFLKPLVPEASTDTLEDAKELSRCLLYWMQTDLGLTGLYLQGDTVGTADGFAKAPYVRESRRIRARRILREQDVSAQDNPGQDRAPEIRDSVGIGAYRIDLHPSTGGDNYIDSSALPFQIPLGSLIPVRTRNLLPACKNLGVTHITNGCTRLHPVEWNIGETAGLLAGFCLHRQLEPAAVLEDGVLLEGFQALLVSQGIELAWPTLGPL